MERKYKLLIVDDDKDVCTRFQNYFANEGFMVEMAGDGIEGFEKLRDDEFDVAIVDINIPNMNGIEMISQALATTDTDANMIMISNPDESNKADVIKALNIGVDAWFEKSELDMSQLLKRVTELAQVIPPDMVKRIAAMIPN